MADEDILLVHGTIGETIVVTPIDKKFTFREIPKRLKKGGWTRDKDLEATIGNGEHLYTKEFVCSKVNDVTAVVVARVSEDLNSFKSCQRLGVFAVEVLSFSGESPYDWTDLNDMHRAINHAVLDLLDEACVPFDPNFKFRSKKGGVRRNSAKAQAWRNWLRRNDLRLLKAERLFFKKLSYRSSLPTDTVIQLTNVRYPDEPEPPMY